MLHIPITRIAKPILLVALVASIGACASESQMPIPTRTPAPTFTPAPAVDQAPVDPVAAATALAVQPVAEQPIAGQPIAEQPIAPVADQSAVQPPPAAAPTDTPVPEPPTPVPSAEVIINTNMNVRGGPSTSYNIVGSASAGERYPVKGKDNASSWWQIDFRGQDGWVFGDLVTAENTSAVAIAQNIPAPPPTAPPPPPAPPPVVEQPPPTDPEPAPPPQSSYQFSKAILQRCDPNAGVTYVQGTTYRNGQPANGLKVAFSYAVDGPIVASIQSGPHQGYEGWNAGFFSHIIEANGAREGDWYFWIVDDNGARISEAAHVHTDGEAGDGRCQQAVIDFDS